MEAVFARVTGYIVATSQAGNTAPVRYFQFHLEVALRLVQDFDKCAIHETDRRVRKLLRHELRKCPLLYRILKRTKTFDCVAAVCRAEGQAFTQHLHIEDCHEGARVNCVQTCVQYRLIQAEILLEYTLEEPIKSGFVCVDCKVCSAAPAADWALRIGRVRVADDEEFLDLLPRRFTLTLVREFAIFDPVAQRSCKSLATTSAGMMHIFTCPRRTLCPFREAAPGKCGETTLHLKPSHACS